MVKYKCEERIREFPDIPQWIMLIVYFIDISLFLVICRIIFESIRGY